MAHPFFTFKRASTIRAETERARELAMPHGVDSFLQDEQQKLDRKKAHVSEVLDIVTRLFERGGVGKYLTKVYPSTARAENLERGYDRQYAIKWVDWDKRNGDEVMYAFVLSEEDEGCRIDFVYRRGEKLKGVPNDNFTGDEDELGYPVVDRHQYEEKFRWNRTYEDFEAFAKAGCMMPEWFAIGLKRDIQPI